MSVYDKPAGRGWRYNPPPTWPVPPAGWEPWPGWQPPVDWSDAPAGWKFWVRPRRSWPARHPVWTGAAAVFALLLIIGAVAGDPPADDPARPAADAAVVTSATPSPTPTASPTPSPTPSETPSPTPSPTPPPKPRPPATKPAPYYPNCTAARAAGAAPIRRGQPGYRPALDGDNDGIACETGGGAAPPAPQPPAPPAPPADPPADVYYANCTEAKAADAAPLYSGQPGYRAGLDRDHDGVACES